MSPPIKPNLSPGARVPFGAENRRPQGELPPPVAEAPAPSPEQARLVAQTPPSSGNPLFRSASVTALNRKQALESSERLSEHARSFLGQDHELSKEWSAIQGEKDPDKRFQKLQSWLSRAHKVIEDTKRDDEDYRSALADHQDAQKHYILAALGDGSVKKFWGERLFLGEGDTHEVELVRRAGRVGVLEWTKGGAPTFRSADGQAVVRYSGNTSSAYLNGRLARKEQYGKNGGIALEGKFDASGNLIDGTVYTQHSNGQVERTQVESTGKNADGQNVHTTTLYNSAGYSPGSIIRNLDTGVTISKIVYDLGTGKPAENTSYESLMPEGYVKITEIRDKDGVTRLTQPTNDDQLITDRIDNNGKIKDRTWRTSDGKILKPAGDDKSNPNGWYVYNDVAAYNKAKQTEHEDPLKKPKPNVASLDFSKALAIKNPDERENAVQELAFEAAGELVGHPPAVDINKLNSKEGRAAQAAWDRRAMLADYLAGRAERDPKVNVQLTEDGDILASRPGGMHSRVVDVAHFEQGTRMPSQETGGFGPGETLAVYTAVLDKNNKPLSLNEKQILPSAQYYGNGRVVQWHVMPVIAQDHAGMKVELQEQTRNSDGTWAEGPSEELASWTSYRQPSLASLVMDTAMNDVPVVAQALQVGKNTVNLGIGLMFTDIYARTKILGLGPEWTSSLKAKATATFGEIGFDAPWEDHQAESAQRQRDAYINARDFMTDDERSVFDEDVEREAFEQGWRGRDFKGRAGSAHEIYGKLFGDSHKSFDASVGSFGSYSFSQAPSYFLREAAVTESVPAKIGLAALGLTTGAADAFIGGAPLGLLGEGVSLIKGAGPLLKVAAHAYTTTPFLIGAGAEVAQDAPVIARAFHDSSPEAQRQAYEAANRLVQSGVLLALTGRGLAKALKSTPRGIQTADSAATAVEPALNPYEVLGIEQDAPWATVKSAFRKVAAENHPDNINRRYGGEQNVPADVKAAAEAKSRQVSQAYHALEAEAPSRAPLARPQPQAEAAPSPPSDPKPGPPPVDTVAPLGIPRPKVPAAHVATPWVPAGAALATGTVPFFATLVQNGVPTGVAALIAGATLLPLAMARFRPSLPPSVDVEADTVSPSDQPVNPTPALSAEAEQPAKPGNAKSASDGPTLVSVQDGRGPKPKVPREIQVEEAKRETAHGTVILPQPTNPEPPSEISNVTGGGQKTQNLGIAEPVDALDYSDFPANRGADPVERLFYIQTDMARETNLSGHWPEIDIHIDHGARLEPTLVTIEVGPTANPVQVNRIRGILGQEGTDVPLKPGRYTLATRLGTVPVVVKPGVSAGVLSASAFHQAWSDGSLWTSSRIRVHIPIANGKFLRIVEVMTDTNPPEGRFKRLTELIGQKVGDASSRSRLIDMVRALKALKAEIKPSDPRQDAVDHAVDKVLRTFEGAGETVGQADIAYAWTQLGNGIRYGAAAAPEIAKNLNRVRVKVRDDAMSAKDSTQAAAND